MATVTNSNETTLWTNTVADPLEFDVCSPSKREQATVKLPFFSVRKRREGASVPVDCPGASNCALAFTSHVAAESYLQAVQLSEYELAMISRQTLDEYLTRLEAAGYDAIGFDPQPNGHGALRVNLAELRTLLAT